MSLSILISWRPFSTQLWVPIFLSASLLAVPMSSTAKSIFIGLSVAFILFLPAYREDLRATLSKPWARAALFLFLIALAGCFWSPASFNEKMIVLEKYSKLLYLPILAVGFRESYARRLALHAFLVAMSITALLSILKFLSVIQCHNLDPGQVFRNHIMTGYMMAFAAYLSALLLVRHPGRRRVIYAVLLFLFSYQVWFVNTGRTGYMIYALLMFLFFLQMFPWRVAILSLLLSCAVLATVFYQHSFVYSNVSKIIQEWRAYQQDDKDSSIGYRLQFYALAHNVFLQHPWIGAGTGGFSNAAQTEHFVSIWEKTWRKKLREPHSQYWLVASEWGLFGLLALAWFFVSLWLAAWRLHAYRFIAIAVLLSFMVGNLSDSLLFYSGTGYFFLLFMALCLGKNSGLKSVTTYPVSQNLGERSDLSAD